jgi:hypothetical protein
VQQNHHTSYWIFSVRLEVNFEPFFGLFRVPNLPVLLGFLRPEGDFESVRADFSSVDFRAVFWPLVAPMPFALNAVYIDVSDR